MSASRVHEFLERAAPAPPPALRDRLRAAVAAQRDATNVPSALLDAGVAIAAQLGAGASKDRAAALDLLAADALVTYAFEAAADEPTRVPALAEEAMRRLAAIAEPA